MKIHAKLLLSLLLMLLSCMVLRAYDSPEQLPNPMNTRERGYVCNPDGILNPQQVTELNSRLSVLSHNTTVEMAVVLVNDIGGNDPAEFAVNLGTIWGVGKSNDNGVMLLIAMSEHEIALQAGYGAEGVLTDLTTDQIIRQQMVPLMRKDDVYGAISAAVTEVTRIVTDTNAAAELRGDPDSALKKKNMEAEKTFMMLLSLVAGISLFGSAGYYIMLWRRSRRLKRDWFARSNVWRKSLWPIAFLGLLSGGIGFIFYFFALWRYRYWRTRRRICHSCGTKMRRLNEQEDNSYLSSAQDTEEKLGTVDYDVWLCDKCGEVERYPFISRQNRFTACPRCGTIAYGIDFERVKVSPTTRHAGVGERVKRCRHCGHSDSEDFTLPRVNDNSAANALAAGAIIGSIASRGSGGSGFSGGGFGGGSFGGGGATGRW